MPLLPYDDEVVGLRIKKYQLVHQGGPHHPSNNVTWRVLVLHHRRRHSLRNSMGSEC